jgi:hypothetical protein
MLRNIWVVHRQGRRILQKTHWRGILQTTIVSTFMWLLRNFRNYFKLPLNLSIHHFFAVHTVVVETVPCIAYISFVLRYEVRPFVLHSFSAVDNEQLGRWFISCTSFLFFPLWFVLGFRDDVITSNVASLAKLIVAHCTLINIKL